MKTDQGDKAMINKLCRVDESGKVSLIDETEALKEHFLMKEMTYYVLENMEKLPKPLVDILHKIMKSREMQLVCAECKGMGCYLCEDDI